MYVRSEVPFELQFRHSDGDSCLKVWVPHYDCAPYDAEAHRGLSFYAAIGTAPNVVSYL